MGIAIPLKLKTNLFNLITNIYQNLFFLFDGANIIICFTTYKVFCKFFLIFRRFM